MENIVTKLNNDAYHTMSSLTIKELEDVIEYTSDKFFNDVPVISDAIFDMLIDFLRIKEPKSKILKNIGAPLKSKDKVLLPFYMGSMDKIKPPSNKLVKFTDTYEAPYIMSDKLDGVSGLLVYQNNTRKLYTRGTATQGMDISILLNYMSNIPSYDNVMKEFGKKIVAFRGELIISKTTFDKKWAMTMKNARNMVSGLVCSKTINPMIAHDTKFVVYQLIEPTYNIIKQFDIIKKLGFNLVHHKKTESLNFEKLSNYLLKRRTKSKYIIDGIIITNNDVHPINIDGNPEYAFAFKDVLEDQKAITIVEFVEWNESKDGYLIPTIIIQPVDVGGVTIKRVTGNNAKFIVDNIIGPGTKVEVIRSNDVIPKIEKVLMYTIPQLPSGDNWKWSDSGVSIISTSLDSSKLKIKNIYHFFSTLNCMGLGEKVIERIYNAGYISIDKILQLSVDDISKIEGFKEKSAKNIIQSIKKCTTDIPLYILMTASNKLGHGFGNERIKSILDVYPNLMTIYTKLSHDEFIKMLKNIDGLDEKMSTMFVSNFDDFIDFYNSIKKYITIITHVNKVTGTKMKEMKVVLSGCRDKNIMEFIINEGGSIINTISKNTDILIIKDNSVVDTAKVVKAKDLGITIYTIDKFNKKYII